MDTRKVATEYRLAQWAQRLQERSERRQSIQEFCEAEGIARNKYFYWQRKVREAACQNCHSKQVSQRLDTADGGRAFGRAARREYRGGRMPNRRNK